MGFYFSPDSLIYIYLVPTISSLSHLEEAAVEKHPKSLMFQVGDTNGKQECIASASEEKKAKGG